ncbi:MAG: ABC transporter ATP-binding protein [Acidimicrobiales bacterium]
MLEVENLTTGYGDRPALHDVSFAVDRGQVAVVLGLNGAGKSTTVKALCGVLPVWSGEARYEGRDITHWRTADCVRAGIVLIPEGRHVFPDLSVDANLQVGTWTHRRNRRWIAEQRERVFEYLPRLHERREQLAGTLSGGEQQMLAIGRGLMARPRLLMIDEASLGLAPAIVKEIFRISRQLTADGTTVILVEQNVGALDVADVGYFMQQGVIVAELRGDELRDTERIRRLYLG